MKPNLIRSQLCVMAMFITWVGKSVCSHLDRGETMVEREGRKWLFMIDRPLSGWTTGRS